MRFDAWSMQPIKHPNVFSLSLMRLVVKSLTLDLQTLLHFFQTCKGCFKMLDSVKLPWQVAVEQEFMDYPNLDIKSWNQTLTSSSDSRVVSALHPVPRTDAQHCLHWDNDEMIAWCVPVFQFKSVSYIDITHSKF